MIRRAARFILVDLVETVQELVSARDLVVTLVLRALIATLRLIECLEVCVFMSLTVGRFWMAGKTFMADARLPSGLVAGLTYPALTFAALIMTRWMIGRLESLAMIEREVPIWGPNTPLWDREFDNIHI